MLLFETDGRVPEILGRSDCFRTRNVKDRIYKTLSISGSLKWNHTYFCYLIAPIFIFTCVNRSLANELQNHIYVLIRSNRQYWMHIQHLSHKSGELIFQIFQM